MSSIVTQYINKLNKFAQNTSTKYIYRGQSDEEWNITSTYYRRLNFKEQTQDWINPTFYNFKKYHANLTEAAKRYKYHNNKQLNDIELLQELQHYGAATGLIDFTYDFLVALWFASTPNGKNGKVFLINTDNQNFKEEYDIDINNIKEEDIYFIDNKFKSNNRVSAQNGVFLFTNTLITNQEAEIIIENTNKQSIREELNRYFNISEETLFQDIFGFAMVNDVNHEISDLTFADYFNRGNTYARNQKYKKAINNYTKVIEIKPDRVEAYNNRGNTYSKLGDYNQAISDYTKAIEIKPDDDKAYYNRGIVYDNLGNYNQAISDYTKAIEINPDKDGAYYNRGIVYDNLGNYNQAISDYTKAIEIKPDKDEAYNNRGIAYTKLGEYDKAIADIKQAFILNPELKSPERLKYLQSLKDKPNNE